ncbi:MAG: signal peptidase I [Actinomycetota bacterium]|nr:signal peptidase I [Actinomycetota bacterium]
MPHESHEADPRDPEGRAMAATLPDDGAYVETDAGHDGDDGWDGPSGPDDGSGDDGHEGDEVGGGFGGVIDNILGGLREILIIAVMAVVLSFVVKTWLIQAFYIPSASMENTLVKDDRVIVSKLTPGPVDLQRGDIVVFQDPDHWLPAVPTVDQPGVRGVVHRGLQFIGLLPDESDDHLIKRVIGLPGDHVVGPTGGGKLTVNGVPITENYVKTGDAPNGSTQPFDIVVPAGRVWVMGDHRGDSADSRYHDDGTGATGSVPINDITGRAVTIVWPLDHVRWLSVPSSIYSTIPAPSPTSTPSTSASSAP